MKRFIISFVLFFAIGAIYAESGTLTVTLVESTPVTGITVITYDLHTNQIIAKVNETYNISVEVSFDGGDTYTAIQSEHLRGDVEEVIPGTEKQITWDGGAGFWNIYSTEAKVKLTATSNVFICGESTVTFTYRGSEVTYGTISKTYNEGESDEYTLCWLDRNLGADPMPFVPATDATGNTDTRLYGDLFQWGRFAEGHQVRANTDHYIGPVSTSVPNDGNDWDGKFITIGPPPYDWLSTQDANLWQGEDGINNPCPPGWRVPTDGELDAERLNWGSNNSAGAYASTLKWPVGGYRGGGGALFDEGSGFVWSSSVSGLYAKVLDFYSGSASMPDYGRAAGVSVRCVREP